MRLTLSLLALAACGGDKTEAPLGDNEAEIGPSGGDLSFEGATLSVPAGAVDTLTVFRIEVGERDAPAGAVTVSDTYSFYPDGFSFLSKAQISLPHTGDPARLSVLWAGEANSFLVPTTYGTEGLATFETDRLSWGFVFEGGPTSACGAVHYTDIFVRGIVLDTRDLPVSGATIRLEERTYAPKVFAEGLTEKDGTFWLRANDIVVVDDCWGTAVDYVLVAERDEYSGERDVNSTLFATLRDGGMQADTSESPVRIDGPTE